MNNSKHKKTSPKISKAMAKNIELVNIYSSNIQRNQSLMNTIKHLHSYRDIRTITSAKSAMDSLMSNDINEFRQKFVKMTKLIPSKLDKQKEKQNAKAEAQDAELAEAVKKVVGKQQPHHLR